MTEGNGETIQAGSGDKYLRLSGPFTIMMFILVLALAAFWWLAWILGHKAIDQTGREHTTLLEHAQKQQESISNELASQRRTNEGLLRDMSENLEEQNYIILTDENERKEIKRRLGRPLSLQKKLRREPD